MQESSGPRHFTTTHWSLIDAAKGGETNQTHARAALEELCRTYWYPLYAFVRKQGTSAQDAQDLIQAFFTRIIETQGLAHVDRQRGRFRSYLLGALKHFSANQWHRSQTQKRGGHVQFLAWDALDPESRYIHTEPVIDNPEWLFDREWALTIVSGALSALDQEMKQAGKAALFETLKGALTGEETLTREAMATRLGMSGGALKVAIHRLRTRYRHLLREAVAETVSNEADLEDEMRYLVTILRRS